MKGKSNIFWSLNSYVKLLFIISLLFAFFYKIFLVHVPILFLYADIIGEIAFNLALSTVASVIFFFFIVHKKEYNDRNNINPIIVSISCQIVNSCFSAFSQMSKASGQNISFISLQKDEISNFCRLLAPTGLSNTVDAKYFQPITWMQFLNEQTFKFDSNTQDLFVLINYVPSSLMVLIYKIKSCRLFYFLTFNANLDLSRTPSFEFLSTEIFDYILLIKELDEYIKINSPGTVTAFSSILPPTVEAVLQS